MKNVQKDLVKQRFFQAKNSYQDNAIVQNKMQQVLLSKMLDLNIPRRCNLIFEFGSGVGCFMEKILQYFNARKVVCSDILELDFLKNKFISSVQKHQANGVNLEFLCFDMDNFLDFVNFKSDLIVSNAVLQWLDPIYFARNISKITQNNGFLCFSTFGRENFKEVREICGFGLDYKDIEFYKQNLRDFEILYFDQKFFTLKFTSALLLFKHLKLTGVSALKNSRISKKMLSKMQQDHENTLTYHAIFIIAKRKNR